MPLSYLKSFSLINWKGIEKALSKFSNHSRAMVVKMMLHWLTTNEKLWQQMHHETALCPWCKEAHETQAHIFNCRHPEAVKAREDTWKKFILTMIDSLAIHNSRYYWSLWPSWKKFFKSPPAKKCHGVTPPSAQIQTLTNKVCWNKMK